MAAGPTTAVQFNNAGALGGDAAFEFSTNKVVAIGPLQKMQDADPAASVARLQEAGAALVTVSTDTVFSRAGVAWIDNSTTQSNPSGEEDALVISRTFNPPSDGSTLLFNGMTIGLSTTRTNTKDQSGVNMTAYTALVEPEAATEHGTIHGLDALMVPSAVPGATQSIVELIGLYTETLVGDGTNTATYNVTKAVGVNVGTTGFNGPQSGTIGTSWGINIEGPRLGSGTGSIGTRAGIRIASQSQGNPGGRNPNSWAIHEDDATDRNALGTVNIGGDAGPLLSAGTGSPNGVVTAPKGSVYFRTDGGAGTTFFVKESGTGNTGWVGK